MKRRKKSPRKKVKRKRRGKTPASSNNLEKTIIKYLSQEGYSPMRKGELGRAINVGSENYSEFKFTLKQLLSSGRIELGRGRRYVLSEAATQKDEQTGYISMTSGGYGFIRPRTPGESEYFVPPGMSRGAKSGDFVAFEPEKQSRGRRGSREKPTDRVRVVKVLKRASGAITGTYVAFGQGGGEVLPDSKSLSEIYISIENSNSAEDGDKVAVELITFNSHSGFTSGELTGRITEILGRAGSYEAERLAALARHGVEIEFPPSIDSELKALSMEPDEKELARRADFSKEVCVTIDPSDAKDFDDAISVIKNKDGFTARVHIADVAHFVKEGSGLDDAARSRSTSVYLPGEAIPMLPEIISNELCSLKEGVRRLTRTVTMSFDAKGRRTDYFVDRSYIRSNCRLAYEEVQSYLDGNDVPRITEDIGEMLSCAFELHKLLRKRRIKGGSLDFEMPEIKIQMNDAGEVVGITSREQKGANRIVEELMLEANRVVAELTNKRGIDSLRRIHEEPDEKSLDEFVRVCEELNINISSSPTRGQLMKALKEAKAKDVYEDVTMALLKAMKMARYFESVFEHWALAFSHYLHFTSPIRRYPDLFVHRALEDGTPKDSHTLKSAGKIVPKSKLDSREKLGELRHLAEHCSIKERAAERAERELVRFRQMEFMRENATGTMQARVCMVKEAGLVVDVAEFHLRCDVPIGHLPEDNYRYRPRSKILQGKNYTYKVGMQVEVELVEVNLVLQQVILRVLVT